MARASRRADGTGGDTPVRPLTGWLLVGAIAAPLSLARGQSGSPPPGVPYLFVLDLAGTALDEAVTAPVPARVSVRGVAGRR